MNTPVQRLEAALTSAEAELALETLDLGEAFVSPRVHWAHQELERARAALPAVLVELRDLRRLLANEHREADRFRGRDSIEVLDGPSCSACRILADPLGSSDPGERVTASVLGPDPGSI
jgi:hypothetical protein